MDWPWRRRKPNTPDPPRPSRPRPRRHRPRRQCVSCSRAREQAQREAQAREDDLRRRAEREAQMARERAEQAQAQIIEAVARSGHWFPNDPLPPSTLDVGPTSKLRSPRWWLQPWRW